MLRSRQIFADECTKKTGKTKEILKSMWNAMECERDSFSDLGGAKETHWERISHARKEILFCKWVTLFPHTITDILKLIIIIMNLKVFNICSAKDQHNFYDTISLLSLWIYVDLRDVTINSSAVSLNEYTMLYLIADLTVFSFTMSPQSDKNKRNRNNRMIFTC